MRVTKTWHNTTQHAKTAQHSASQHIENKPSPAQHSQSNTAQHSQSNTASTRQPAQHSEATRLGGVEEQVARVAERAGQRQPRRVPRQVHQRQRRLQPPVEPLRRHANTHPIIKQKTEWHSTAQHSTAQHSSAEQHSTARQHSTAQQHSTARHSAAQHGTRYISRNPTNKEVPVAHFMVD
jgi:hypothetical protein